MEQPRPGPTPVPATGASDPVARACWPITSARSITFIARHVRRGSWTGRTSPTRSGPTPAPRQSICRWGPTASRRRMATSMCRVPSLRDRSIATASRSCSSWRWGCRPGSSTTDQRWALRCNPSSGNLHPTEGYAILPELPGLEAGVYHYDSHGHRLERRCSTGGLGSVRTGAASEDVSRRPVHDRLARSVEIRRAGLPLLPARHWPRSGRAALRGRGAGLDGSAARSRRRRRPLRLAGPRP